MGPELKADHQLFIIEIRVERNLQSIANIGKSSWRGSWNEEVRI
jgi:hypothetical protein